jgi:hypothetical protein
MESGMQHQDNDNLRTRLHQLKAVISTVVIADYKEIKLHGNATIDATAIAVMATKSQRGIQ